MQTRLRVVLLFFLVALAGLIARLFYWQIIKGDELSSLARSQYKKGLQIEHSRGEIYSSDGSWLVANEKAWFLYAEPKKIDGDKDKIATYLVDILFQELQDSKERLVKHAHIKDLLSREKSLWVPIRRGVSKEQKEQIEKLSINGLGFEEEERRTYPEASMAAHLLGFVGRDDNGDSKGYFGLEGYYDFILRGGRVFAGREANPKGIPIVIDGAVKSPSSSSGVSLVTSIDKVVQRNVEKKLEEGIQKYGAKGGNVVVMNPENGEILAMAASPSFDPYKYYEFGDKYFMNPVISSTFEPGSIMKVVVMASAIDAGLVDADTICPVCDGPRVIGEYSIRTWNNKYHKNATMTDIIVESDNVGMSYVGSLLGQDRMYDYLRAFGFGDLTGIDLQGEISPALRKKGEWKEIDIATASFGQGIAVTPIQMITAVASIANRGLKVRPRVVRALMLDDWRHNIEPAKPERVISEKAAEEITAMMVEAAKRGEAKWTYLRGFKVAGKTGTAQIPIEGHYDEEKTIASFIGFAPSVNPKFVMIVTLREPSSSPWASETAAPLWFSIAQELFKYFGISPED
jgi:cell division protein FtsI/penicillin-binding protein 2